jgi:hypothetical protein
MLIVVFHDPASGCLLFSQWWMSRIVKFPEKVRRFAGFPDRLDTAALEIGYEGRRQCDDAAELRIAPQHQLRLDHALGDPRSLVDQLLKVYPDRWRVRKS